MLEQVLGLAVDLEKAALVVRGVEGRDLGDVLILALALLLLELEGDAADGSALNALHQMSGVAGNLVAEALGGDDGNLIADALVGLKVERQAGVVALNDDLGGLLDGLGADATHVGGVVVVVVGWRGGVLVKLSWVGRSRLKAALMKFRPSGKLVVALPQVGHNQQLGLVVRFQLVDHVNWPTARILRTVRGGALSERV